MPSGAQTPVEASVTLCFIGQKQLSLYGINTTFLTYSIAAGAGGLLCESETPRSLRTDLGGGGIVSCADRRDRICVALHHSPEKQKVNKFNEVL